MYQVRVVFAARDQISGKGGVSKGVRMVKSVCKLVNPLRRQAGMMVGCEAHELSLAGVPRHLRGN